LKEEFKDPAANNNHSVNKSGFRKGQSASSDDEENFEEPEE
jgi:hypothetical protein